MGVTYKEGLKMEIGYGIFLGVCMFVAYGVGYRRAWLRGIEFTNHLLLKMDSDMDGAVETWIKKRKRHIKDKAHEV